jgi:hypothetical protein
MWKLLIVLIVGLAMGYRWGYDEGSNGRPSIVVRTLDHFGTSKLKAAQEARDKRVEDASKP